MTSISKEYAGYQRSSVMSKLAKISHGTHYIGQSSSAIYPELISEIKKTSLPHEAAILDAGCGCGCFSLKLAKDFGFRVHGVDLSEDLISKASLSVYKEKLGSSCTFSIADFTDFKDKKFEPFDLIFSIGSLYWGQSIGMTLSGWKKKLTAMGTILIFINLSYNTLEESEQKAMGSTQFISAQFLMKEMVKQHLVIREWKDYTETYIDWLFRWCNGIDKLWDELIGEMGEANALQMQARFKTYLGLAQKRKVCRIILRCENGNR